MPSLLGAVLQSPKHARVLPHDPQQDRKAGGTKLTVSLSWQTKRLGDVKGRSQCL